jgi:non-ribosomal peptide synthetase component F
VSAASLFHLAWAQVLSRISVRKDVVFGTVLFGRMQGGEGADRIMGPSINTLPLRIEIGDRSVRDSVRRTHAMLTELMRHEHASLVLAQRCSGVPAPTPLFSALLNYRHVIGASRRAADKYRLAQQEMAWLTSEERTHYPCTLSVDDFAEGFRLTAQVNAAIDPGRVCAYMQTALESLVAALEYAPDTPMRSLEVLPAEERAQVLYRWNATETDFPAHRLVHELFEEQMEKTPDAVAVIFEGQELSYRELNRKANRLAHYLRELGVGPDMRVAICVERGFEMIVGLLAIIKCGGAYVPWTRNTPWIACVSWWRTAAPRFC